MAKQIFVSFPPIGQQFGSDARILERAAKKVFDAVGAHPVTGLWRSPLGGAKATVDDGDSSQDTANALAQGVKDSGGPSTGYKAQEIDSAGVVTDLVAPAPA